MKVKMRAEVLEMALIRSNKSQGWLAEKLGVTRATISNYLRKESSVSPRVRERMLSVFTDFSFDDLFIIEKEGNKEIRPGNGKDNETYACDFCGTTFQEPTHY